MKIKSFILFTIFFLSCSNSYNKTKNEVDLLAEKIQIDFESVSSSVNEIATYMEEVYKNYESVKYDVQDITTDKGGIFRNYEGMYYRIKIGNEGSVLATGNPPVDIKIKNKLKFLDDKALEKVQDIKESNDILNSSWYFSYDNIAVGYPYYDVVSTLPPGVDLFSLPWATMAYRDAAWSPDPFVSLSSGWFMTRAAPVFNNNKLEGIATSDIRILDLTYKYIDHSSYLLLLISQNTTLVGMSDKLSEILKTPKLSSYEYLTQLHENPETEDEYKLLHESRDKYLREMAIEVLEGKNNVNTIINDKKYRVYYRKIPEVNLYIIGLLRY